MLFRSDSLIALDAATGKRLWHFQGVHHDIWDRDFPAAPILVTVSRNGKQIPAVAQTTKQGDLYVFNRVTGDPLFPIEDRAYPASTTPGEVAATHQPHPLKPEPFARQTITEDTLTTRTPEAHEWAVKRFREMRNDGQFVPLSVGKDTLVSPSFEGGGEWGGPAIDPTTHILYINANNYASIGALAVHSGDSPGRTTYLAQCSVCHGEHRAGTTEFPSLVNITRKRTNDQIIAVIHDGKGRMPASPNLPGAKLTALLEYLQTEKDLAPSSANASEEQAASPAKTSTASDVPGAHVYQTHCAICHGDRREGVAPSFPALIGVGDRYTDTQILALIHDGKGRMPPITKLSQHDLDDLMRFLRPLGEQPTPGIADTSTTQYSMTGYRRFLDPDGYPAVATPWGTLNALDLNTGNYLWSIPLGQYPELVAKGMPDTGSENYGGPIVTAGGLLFIGATNFDKKFRAFDKTTGKLLWETTLPFAANATPATYEANGRQYVVIATGGSTMNPRGSIGGVYVAFALPQ